MRPRPARLPSRSSRALVAAALVHGLAGCAGGFERRRRSARCGRRRLGRHADALRLRDPEARIRQRDPGVQQDLRRFRCPGAAVLRRLRRPVPQGRGRAQADVVNFSVEPDITRLVDAGLVDPTGTPTRHKGIPFGSVVAIVVRKGNPKGIKDWDDLLKPGVEVVTPNPFSSGSAKWNLLAPYAAESDGGKNPQAGLDLL